MDQQKIVTKADGIFKKYKSVMLLMKDNPLPYDKSVINYTTGIMNDIETLRYMRIFLSPLKQLSSKTFSADVNMDAISNTISDIRGLLEKIGATFGCKECPPAKALSEMELITAAANLNDDVSKLVIDITTLSDEISGWEDYNMTPDRGIAKAMLHEAKEFVKNECAESASWPPSSNSPVEPISFPGYVANRIVDTIKHL